MELQEFLYQVLLVKGVGVGMYVFLCGFILFWHFIRKGAEPILSFIVPFVMSVLWMLAFRQVTILPTILGVDISYDMEALKYIIASMIIFGTVFYSARINIKDIKGRPFASILKGLVYSVLYAIPVMFLSCISILVFLLIPVIFPLHYSLDILLGKAKELEQNK